MLNKIIPYSFLVALLFTACAADPKTNEDSSESDPLNGYNFLWDFNGNKEFRYDYDMTSVTTESRAKEEEPYTIKEQTVGDFLVKSKGNREASVSIQNVLKTMFSQTEEGDWSPAKPRSSNAMDIGVLKQYSKFENERLDAVWDAFLPLPMEEIKEGETYSLKMKIPVTMENRKYVRGTNQLTFDGYETILGKKCIKLQGTIDVSELDPIEFSGIYEHSLMGTGVYYFSPEDHCFVQADVELKLRLFVDSSEESDPMGQFYVNAEYTDVFKIRMK